MSKKPRGSREIAAEILNAEARERWAARLGELEARLNEALAAHGDPQHPAVQELAVAMGQAWKEQHEELSGEFARRRAEAGITSTAPTFWDPIRITVQAEMIGRFQGRRMLLVGRLAALAASLGIADVKGSDDRRVRAAATELRTCDEDARIWRDEEYARRRALRDRM